MMDYVLSGFYDGQFPDNSYVGKNYYFPDVGPLATQNCRSSL